MKSSETCRWHMLMYFFFIVLNEDHIVGAVLMCCNNLDSLIVEFIDASVGQGTNLIWLEQTDTQSA